MVPGGGARPVAGIEGGTMGQWGLASYEGDDAADALDRAFEAVHGSAYESLMDDHDPLPFEAIQAKLANPETLAAAVSALEAAFSEPPESWDEEQRLAFCGVVVRHRELGVPIPEPLRLRALEWLRAETIEWEEEAERSARRAAEIEALGRGG